MPRVLEGKLGIITGASRGIGEGIAHNLAAKGANLIITYSSPSSASMTHSLAETISETHSVKVFALQADMGNPADPANLIAQTAQHFSPLHIDILVNNAAVGPQGSIADVTAADFHYTFAVNVLGPLLLMQAALPYLHTDRSGRVVNVSSAGSTLGMKGQSVYAGSKGALEAMTRTWARELAERATVNAVTPGPTRTELYFSVPEELFAGLRPGIQSAPLMAVREGVDPPDVVADAGKIGGRLGEPHEVAGIVGMLCTPDSAWCTGQVVSANGGMLF